MPPHHKLQKNTLVEGIRSCWEVKKTENGWSTLSRFSQRSSRTATNAVSAHIQVWNQTGRGSEFLLHPGPSEAAMPPTFSTTFPKKVTSYKISHKNYPTGVSVSSKGLLRRGWTSISLKCSRTPTHTPPHPHTYTPHTALQRWVIYCQPPPTYHFLGSLDPGGTCMEFTGGHVYSPEDSVQFLGSNKIQIIT